MKYWIFQSNQVLGPYEPDDLSRHSAFGAESLVCPEGRRGTTMGDWQRAGMVPDLSVALVRAAQAQGSSGSVATLAGLPPEPTLKDLALLGSLQEKMAMMEDVVLQLQEGLRLKDAELASLHQELAGKDRQSSVMKSSMEREAAELKAETEERKREAEDLQSQTNEFKKKMAELEERVGVVNRLSETVEKAVEAEKHVEHDVEAQAATIAELTKEIETLRGELTERLAAAAAVSAPAAPAFAAPAPAAPAPLAGGGLNDEWGKPSVAAEMPSLASVPAPSFPAPLNDIAIPGKPPAPGDLPKLTPPPPPSPAASPEFPASAPLPAFDGGAMPSFGAAAPPSPIPIPLDPMAAATILPSAGAAAPGPDAAAPAPAPASGGRKKALVLGGLFGVVMLAAYAYLSGRFGNKKPSMPASMADTAPLPPPTLPPPAPVPPPAPPVDPRESAISAAKEWELPDGRRLGQALETLSPPIGNLSPWMAEPLTDGRVSVNYFAHGGASGSPTVAYEFEVDLAAKSVSGRNPAAKAVLAGKASPPPAPPKAKHVILKRKAKPKAPAPKPAPKKQEENLDSLLGTDSSAAPKPEASLAGPAGESPAEEAPPGEDVPAKPAKKTAAKRAAKASTKAAPAAKSGKAADEALLDDILKE